MDGNLFSSPTPFTPPTTEEDRLVWLRLIRSRRVGASTFYRLLKEFGTARAALAELPAVARAAGVQDYAACPSSVAEAEMKAADRAGAYMICFGSPEYPPALATIADPPPLLWALGQRELLARPMVAMVGARNASSLGTRMARRMAEGLGSAGIVVVSGLARGVDAAAHHAALDSGTVAVQAGGVDVIYPLENTALAESIALQGLRLSEQPMGMAPQARHFPRRNRIIAGLAHAVVVVEAAARSGSLITTADALEQGREVMAVPGHPMDARAAGCNELIRSGATLVRGAEDVLNALRDALPASPPPPGAQQAEAPEKPPAATTQTPAAPPSESRACDKAQARSPRGAPAAAGGSDTAALHRQILDRLGPSPMAEDQLIRDIGLPAAHIMPELMTLELEGRVSRQPGGMLARA